MTTAPPALPDLPALPPLDDLLDRMRVVAIPLHTRFRGQTVRESVLFEGGGAGAGAGGSTGAGPAGEVQAAEFSPFPEYDDAEAAVWLRAALDYARPTAGDARVPASAPLRDEIWVNATSPAVGADEVEGVLARYDGCRTVKVKVAERGQTLADDVARVREVRRLVGPEGRIRVDANGAWNVDEAEHAVRALEPFDLEYVEQPCASVDELAQLRARIHDLGILVAADESVRKAEDPLAVARAGAADILVVKVQPLGGVTRALELVREAGLPAVVSSALETSVGIGMGAALAAALPALDYDCGLATVDLFTGDVVRESLVPRGGRIPVRRPPLDPELLGRYAAAPEREQWWRERVARCHALLSRT